jgi:hypothetical protein
LGGLDKYLENYNAGAFMMAYFIGYSLWLALKQELGLVAANARS